MNKKREFNDFSDSVGEFSSNFERLNNVSENVRVLVDSQIYWPVDDLIYDQVADHICEEIDERSLRRIQA